MTGPNSTEETLSSHDELDQRLSAISAARAQSHETPHDLIQALTTYIHQRIQEATTPKEAMLIVPAVIYNEDYMANADMPEMPTAMSIDHACKKRAMQLGGDGCLKKEWFRKD